MDWSSFRGTRSMAKDDKPLKDGARESARDKTKSATERPFDLWLQKQLHAMYDEIANEPLPEDLLKLIERDAEGGKGPASSTKK
jgi:hypothetical protein